MPLSKKKPQNNPKNGNFGQKKHDIQDFWNGPSVMFSNFPKNCFWGVVGFFLTQECFILSA